MLTVFKSIWLLSLALFVEARAKKITHYRYHPEGINYR